MKVKIYGTKYYMKWVGEYEKIHIYKVNNPTLLKDYNRFEINKDLYPTAYKDEEYMFYGKKYTRRLFLIPKIFNVVDKTERVFLKEINIDEKLLLEESEYRYGDYIFSTKATYDLKEECYVIDVGYIEEIQLNKKEDVIDDFNYILGDIEQLNNNSYNEMQNNIEELREQLNNKNSINIFTKFKNLFK